MRVNLDKEDLIRLVKGTGGPGDYSGTFDFIGRLEGFPNERWVWKDDILNNMKEDVLWDIYWSLKKHKKEK